MWLQDKWQQIQQVRAQRYLGRHPQLGLDILRMDTDLASKIFEVWAAQDKSGPRRDSLEYPTMASMAYGGRTPLSRTLPKPTPWNIRAFSAYPPARRAINVLSNPILELPFSIGVRQPMGTNAHDDTPGPTQEQQARIVAATEMLLQPNDQLDGRAFLEMLLEDLIVLGSCPFEVQENSSDARPLFLWPVDAQSIRVNLQWSPGASTFRYSQGKGYVYGAVGVGDEVKFDDDHLCVPLLNPRSHTPFGLGYLEVAFDTVNSWLGAFQFATRRASNETPNFGLFLGENMTPEQVRRFQSYWVNEIEGAGKIPIIGGGRAPSAFTFTQGTGKDPLWILWQEYLLRVIAMSFGVSPMRLSLERDVNRSTAAVGVNDDWATVAPVAGVLKSTFTRWILWKRLGWRDLEFEWQVKNTDELKQAQILAEQYQMNCITVDELRQIYERPPLADGLGDMVRSAFESSIAYALTPDPPPVTEDAPAQPGQRQWPPAQQPIRTPKVAAALAPFGDVEADMLSPSELAFVRELSARITVDDLEEVAG